MVRIKTFDWREFSLRSLVREKKSAVSVVIPSKNEAKTIGGIVGCVKRLSKAGLVDEIVVIDAGSRDGTVRAAASAGAKVYDERRLLPQLGNCLGKGNAIYKSIFVTTGEIIVFVDADIEDFDERFIVGLLGPLIRNPRAKFAKAFYGRPFVVGKSVLKSGGGRVTEILARPLLNLFYPQLNPLKQPLSGEYAVRREVLKNIDIPSGYGVEIAFLIEILRKYGVGSLAQVNLKTRRHRNQPVLSLGKMGFEILRAFIRFAEKDGKLKVQEISETYFNPITRIKIKSAQSFHKSVLPGKTEFIFLRHGKTDWNEKKMIQSGTDIPLNSKGISQAKAAAEKLKKERITAIYTSPLRRAKRTAEIVAAKFGIYPRQDSRLVEIHHGDWVGKSEAELAARDRELFNKWKKQPWRYVPPAGEKWGDFRNRVRNFLRDIGRRHAGEKILIVTHKGVIAVASTILKGERLDKVNRYPIGNCEWTKYKIENEKLKMKNER
ncbi:MAG: glucosyl-3-phosphoglycerate synthase [Elusimicrobia bacterium]|nr:glucosyl-3-phosphoglycerate synthase [Elusimicrobiota bacterium]